MLVVMLVVAADARSVAPPRSSGQSTPGEATTR